MNIYTVSLFGHREVPDFKSVENLLLSELYRLFDQHEFISFVLGRNGEFDEYAAMILKRIQRQYGKDRCEIILVLPYLVSDIEYYATYYDSVYIPEEISNNIYPKRAITVRNRIMIDQSDEIIFYVNKNKGGAYMTYKYAIKCGKRFVNIAK